MTEPASAFAASHDAKFEVVGKETARVIRRLYGGRSLRIRAVDGGSTNAEEIELTALGNASDDSARAER